ERLLHFAAARWSGASNGTRLLRPDVGLATSRSLPSGCRTYGMMVIVTDGVNNKKDTDLLVSALAHLDRWNEFHRTSALQTANFFVLTAAVLGAAYVSALNGHHDAIAGVAAVAGGAFAGVTYLIFRRQGNIAHLADRPLKEIQGRIADELGIDSYRM